MAVSTVSYTKTPQANGDYWAFSEDFSGLADGKSILLDVMANDLGGNAKSLYSIDNGDLLTDLLTKDPGLCTPWEKTALGHEIRINNGQIEYRLASDGFDLDSLAEGVQTCDTFKYAIQLGNGTISYATVTLNFTGVNDAARITGDVSGSASETDDAVQITGKLTATDVDNAAGFQAQTLTGTKGSLVIDAAGNWTFTANSAFDSLNVGDTAEDTFKVKSVDGTEQVITVTITGTNDAAVLSSATENLTETDSAGDISTSGQLSISDVDSDETFVAQSDVQGDHGTFSINASGAWTYTADSEHNEFKAGVTYTDTFTVASADGTETSVTVNILGTNDAAVLSSATKELTETDSAADIGTSGQLSISDVDSDETFVAQSDSGGLYGKFSIDASGAWTYTADSEHNEFKAGVTYTDTFTVASADGTETSVTVNILGTNDAAVLSSATKELTETDSAADIGTSGQLSISDVDSDETFVAQSDSDGLYGKFSIDASGAWTYTADSEHNEFKAGVTYTDTFTVASADGTETSVTVNIFGANDGAVLSSADVAKNETNAPLTFDGQLSISDVDSDETFVAQSNEPGQYGQFSIDANGAWTYVADSAHNEFVAGQTYTDTFEVESADGTTTTVKVTINGTNDAAALSSADASKAETNAPLTFNGTLTIDDVDSQETFAAQTDTPGTYGKFSIDAGGNWTYTANSALDSLNPGQSASDAFDVFSADGTKTTVKITITGTADGPLVGPSPYEGTGDPSDATEIDKAAASAVTFNGSGNSADTVYGSNSVDNIDAKNGADKIYGFGGNDILKGGPGTDQIYGGAGDDVIDGDADDDALYGGSGADTIDGKGGSDTIVGGYGADSLTGGAQADVFVYLDAKDTGDTITNFGDVLNANGRFVNNDGDKIDLSALDAVTLGFTADKTSLSAHSVISFYDASAGKTIVQVDTDGNASTVELQIQLTGNIELVAGDFILT